jgi:carbon monoxide dehydrogenase subunit G
MWYMKPVIVSIDLPQSRQAVFDFLDVMANHEPFTDHILKGWEYSGPDRGVGSKARVHVSAAGRTDTVDIEVIDAERPARIVERNIGAAGKRVATGTYTLTDRSDGGTHVQFTYAWQRVPLSERVMAPVVRSMLRRANERAMTRLSEHVTASVPA